MKTPQKIAGIICLTTAAIVEIGEHVEVIHSHLPHWATTHSQDVIIALLAGLLLFLMATYHEKESSEVSTPAVGGSATAVANPVISPTIDASQHHYHYPPAQPKTKLPDKPKKKHNVTFTGFGEIPQSKDDFKSFVATFENIPMPHEEIANFTSAKAKVEIRSKDESERFVIIPAMWLRHHHAESINLNAGCPEHVVIATYFQPSWKMQRIVEAPSSWGMFYEPEELDLPEGEYKVLITLVGFQNVSTVPVEASFTVGKDGSLTFARIV